MRAAPTTVVDCNTEAGSDWKITQEIKKNTRVVGVLTAKYSGDDATVSAEGLFSEFDVIYTRPHDQKGSDSLFYCPAELKFVFPCETAVESCTYSGWQKIVVKNKLKSTESLMHEHYDLRSICYATSYPRHGGGDDSCTQFEFHVNSTCMTKENIETLLKCIQPYVATLPADFGEQVCMLITETNGIRSHKKQDDAVEFSSDKISKVSSWYRLAN